MREYEVLYDTIEDGWIMATVPDLPGAVTQGQTMEEARSNILEVIELLLASYRENAIRQASSHVVREVVTVADFDDVNRK
jgi:predicted RNase H-like HicB family nuclease